MGGKQPGIKIFYADKTLSRQGKIYGDKIKIVGNDVYLFSIKELFKAMEIFTDVLVEPSKKKVLTLM